MNSEFSLTPLSPKDLPLLCDWFNDTELCQFMEDSEENIIYTPEDLTDMVQEDASKNLKVKSRYYAFRSNQVLAGYASIYDIDPVQKKAEYSILIGDKNSKGKGYGRILVDLVCQEARALGLAMLYCSIYENNMASIKSVEKCGFKALREMPASADSTAEWYFEKQL